MDACCARTPKCTGSREGGIAETYVPNREQLIRRGNRDSELARHRIGEPERVYLYDLLHKSRSDAAAAVLKA